MVTGDGLRRISEAELIELIGAAASELQRRQAGNDTVPFCEFDRKRAAMALAGKPLKGRK